MTALLLESAKKYGVDDSQRTRHATFLDYDKDGFLDLLINSTSKSWRLFNIFGPAFKTRIPFKIIQKYRKNHLLKLVKKQE